MLMPTVAFVLQQAKKKKVCVSSCFIKEAHTPGIE